MTLLAKRNGEYRFGYQCLALQEQRSPWEFIWDLKTKIRECSQESDIVEYLAFIREHTFKQIQARFPEFQLVEFVVTCPANYAESSQRFFTACLGMAGWPTAQLRCFIWEQEALAYQLAQKRNLVDSVNWLVIDAGGGTMVSFYDPTKAIC